MKTEPAAPTSKSAAKRRWKRVFAWTPGILFVAVTAWFYLGFFVVDPLRSNLANMIAWAARVAVPLVIAVCLGMGLALRRKKVRATALATGILALLLGGGILFLAAVGVCALRAGTHDLSQYHPYLQLTPHPVVTRAAPRGEKPIRVFCLGDSTTEFTDTKGKGWPALLEEKLTTDGGPAVEVYNAGRRSYTSVHSLINYELNLRRQKPDILIVMHGISDLLQNADFATRSLGPFRPDYGHFAGPAANLLKRESALQQLRRAFRSVWWHRKRRKVEALSLPGLSTYRRAVKTLLELAQADGVRVVLMTQPHLFKPNQLPEEQKVLHLLNSEAVGPRMRWGPTTALRGMRAYNDLTRRIAAEEGLTLVDLERAVPKTLEYLRDDVHYQDKGVEAVADLIAQYIGPLVGIVPEVPAPKAEGDPASPSRTKTQNSDAGRADRLLQSAGVTDLTTRQ